MLYLPRHVGNKFRPVLVMTRPKAKIVKWNLKYSSKNVGLREKQMSFMKYLQAKIKFSGPLTIHEYMKEVLTNPISGYYMKKSAIGEKGDFITSPEISQMFGELLALWIYNEWKKMGAPKPFQLIEFGPGTGTLMQDILRVLKNLKIGKSDVEIHLIEKSPLMSDLQLASLCGDDIANSKIISDSLQATYRSSHTKDGIPVHWHNHFSDIPDGFSMVYAHEFFDALPIHQLKKTEDGWREILVDIQNNGESGLETDELRYVLSRSHTPASKLYVDDNEERSEMEVSPETGIIIQQLSKRLEENGGAALIIDYGHNGTLGETFRAFKNHRQVPPLSSPGEADLTADVDFSYLKRYAEDKLVAYGPVNQSFFLKNMGIELRLQELLKNCEPNQYKSLINGYKMLVDPDQMGERFKVFALLPKVMKEILIKYPPAGFFRSFDKE